MEERNNYKVQRLWAFKRERKREKERNFFFTRRTPTLAVSK